MSFVPLVPEVSEASQWWMWICPTIPGSAPCFLGTRLSDHQIKPLTITRRVKNLTEHASHPCHRLIPIPLGQRLTSKGGLEITGSASLRRGVSTRVGIYTEGEERQRQRRKEKKKEKKWQELAVDRGRALPQENVQFDDCDFRPRSATSTKTFCLSKDIRLGPWS